MRREQAVISLIWLVAFLPACRGTFADLGSVTPNCANELPAEKWTDLLAKNPPEEVALVELHEHSTPEKSGGGWVQENGRISARGGATFRSLITRCPVGNFELEFAWSVSMAGNSGIKYLVSASPGPTFAKGLEYQILDDAHHPDARAGENRQSGALYDLMAPAKTKKLNPPGETNLGRIVFKNGKGEHWLNGAKILEFDTANAEFQKRILQSKFRHIPDFARGARGHLLLQHHGDAVEFSQLRIRSNLVDDQVVRNPERWGPGPARR
ncbi:MAG: hypothetical protein RIQ81_1240 [Pseudomonadota bacterium]|jgi:hypothetical protein